MATQSDVRRIALALPEVLESQERFEFSVVNRGKAKSLAWVWMERIGRRTARVPNPGVLAVRVDGEAAKQFLVGAVPGTFFTEPHYDGFPAVLIRLEAIGVDELEALLVDAWRLQAPKALVKEFDAMR